jgi:hypothetical protein
MNLDNVVHVAHQIIKYNKLYKIIHPFDYKKINSKSHQELWNEG